MAAKLEDDGRFQGARLVSGVFFAASILVFVAGTAASVVMAHSLHYRTHETVVLISVASFAGSLLVASSLAFFGYVLALLRDLRRLLRPRDEVQ